MEEAEEKLADYKYEILDQGRTRRFVITDGLNPRKYKKITLAFTQYPADYKYLQMAGVSDKLNQEVWLLYQAEYILAQEQGTVDDMYSRFANKYPGFKEKGPDALLRDSMVVYKLMELIGPEDGRYELACLLKELFKETFPDDSIAMSVYLVEFGENVEVTYDAGPICLINFTFHIINEDSSNSTGGRMNRPNQA